MRSLLGVRSFYSLLYGVCSPAEIMRKASEWKVTSLAISDRENLYGVHDFLEVAKDSGIRPIVSVEFVTRQSASLFVFVRDRKGFSRVCRLVSTVRTEHEFDIVNALIENSQGLVVATDDVTLLEAMAHRIPFLFAAVTPRSLGSIPCARRLGLPLAALEDSVFIEPEDMTIHSVLRAIALGKTVGSLDMNDRCPTDARLLSPEEMDKLFSSWPQALEGTERIAELCTFDTIFDGFIFPDYMGKQAFQELRKRVLTGAEKRYGEISDAIMDRIDYELDIIGQKGFAPYFLVMDDIVAMASRTCGRGSAAASIVSYSLGITNVDPIAHNLYFERFLTVSRPDPPDIDVDFAWDERDELLNKVIERFGRDRCARVGNHNRFRARCALRETAKAYGIPDATISQAERTLFEQQNIDAIDDPLWRQVLTIAKRIEGLPRGISMHCGGLVITPGPIADFAPVERSAQGFPLLGWEKEGTEAAGLVKLDLLGNRSLAVIRDTLQNLHRQGIIIDEHTWRPAEDKITQEALAQGDSMGVFYIESPAMRQLQIKTGKGDFDHIVIHSSIIRPAANKYIAEYVRRLKGGSWNPLHPRLSTILAETYGILCYQEDVSKTAVALAGFSEADADTLRKIISKKAGGTKLHYYKEQFFNGCAANKVESHTVEEIWSMMLSFDGYSFCKPHSASYAMVSFQSAYLRTHYPAAFMAAVLSNQGGYYRAQAYISEARRMGLSIDGPDINRSMRRYYAQGSSLVIGFMAIGNLTKTAVSTLISERQTNGYFIDLNDVISRIAFSTEDVVSLVAAGVFDSIVKQMPRTLQARTLLAGMHKMALQRQSLFAEPALPVSRLLQKESQAIALSIPNQNELREEFATLGFLRRSHPLLLWASQIAKLKRIRACDIPAWEGRFVTLLGWPVTQKEIWTKDGLAMNFVSFEDETALYETVLFPQTYQRFRNILFGQKPLIVRGSVQNEQGALSIEVRSVTPL